MLPKIDVPTFAVELPSTKQKIVFRPFLVKEQKLFLMNNENSTPEDIVNVIRQVLKNCVITSVDIDSLPVFDLEYLFMNLRARSVSEVINLKYKCNNKVEDKECNTINEINLNVLEIKPTFNESHTNKIPLNETIGVVLKYPTFEMMQKMVGKNEGEMIMDMIYNCIDYVYDKDSVYYTKDISRKELEEFIDNIQQKDMEKMKVFFDTMPKIKKDIDYVCKKCQYSERITLEGIQDFFG